MGHVLYKSYTKTENVSTDAPFHTSKKHIGYRSAVGAARRMASGVLFDCPIGDPNMGALY